ncbi:MAG TPA: hypothetical protein VJO53_05840 [Candidatus Acidoferrales bacterium]|nr:hypothetical protein [Candidatus Acidoferrales bacterium]
MAEDTLLGFNFAKRDSGPFAGPGARCDSVRCGEVPICSLRSRFFCLNHFISHCYERLGEYASPPACVGDEKFEINFLEECSEKSANLLVIRKGLHNLEKARLFDILLWSTELDRKWRLASPLASRRAVQTE